ncbi:PTS 2-O-a-mannosyl-D-glycerate transporter subunit IIABC [Thorsellia anophelis]|uniref:PTS system, 2-O-A-mannosyl-D-glycerate-specific IIC component n=1 Tax=Thorsellia anophelis DSM 18579 TaxID=1123402 RepID=A0A1H9YEX0_9GAMM|nr:PTS 2-O-a-mannosyl-D-glycerate transporter subunit IIABC [Thorsellia anophelis]SES67510.1 PTS system, 2-O-A-mannosyl-D-glycerate-specific IIC component [Thorsellia anophelis DSM 18579]
MNLSALTNQDLILIKSPFKTRDEAINALIDKLYQQGKISDKTEFLNAVMQRESEGPTALGEGLAIPHGKSLSVKEAAFAVATIEGSIDWEGIDGDESVNLVFLLAIPSAEAGTTHIQLLTQLTTALVDDDTREAIVQAVSPANLFELLSQNIAKQSEESTQTESLVQNDSSELTVVCVTACPAGIAHTYMAAEYLEKAGKKLGIRVVVEKQGANGIEGRISNQDLQNATACIFAAEVAIKEVERFAGIPTIKVPVAEPIKRAESIIQEVIEKAKHNPRQANVTETSTPVEQKVSVKTELKQALLSGISFAVPLIVAGGTVLAVAVLITQIFGLQEVYETENSWLWLYRKLGGNLLGVLMVPVLSAYTAYSLADKPALGPGFAAGVAANLIGSGFLGGVVGGLIAGYVMRYVKKHIRLSPTFNGFLSFYLYPVIGTLIAGSLMLFVVGKPVALINTGLTTWLNSLSGSNALLLGLIIGCFVSFDLGGPVNKAAYAFCLGAMANGVYGPYAIFASVKMVSAFTVTASTMIAPRLFKDFEIETGKSTWLLGLAGITEGAIPMAIEDPIRVIGSFLLGSAVTGALVGWASIGLSTPGAGIFSMFLLTDNPLGAFASAGIWFGAALLGALISTITLIAWRKQAVSSGKFAV